MTKVIFREWCDGNGESNGELIALMPEVIADMNYGHCASYMHIGQHGSANYQCVMQLTKPAYPPQVDALRQELEGLGYKVELRYRRSAQMVANHREEMKKLID